MQHSLTADGGYNVGLELKSKLPEVEIEDLVEVNQGDFTEVVAYYRDQKSGKKRRLPLGIRPNRGSSNGCTITNIPQSWMSIGSGDECEQIKHKPPLPGLMCRGMQTNLCFFFLPTCDFPALS